MVIIYMCCRLATTTLDVPLKGSKQIDLVKRKASGNPPLVTNKKPEVLTYLPAQYDL